MKRAIGFYASLFKEIPQVLRGTVEAWAFWLISVGLPLMALLAPRWAGWTDAASKSPWLVVLSLVLSTSYALLRVNYERFAALESSLSDERRLRAEAEAKLRVRRKNQALADELTRRYKDALHSILNRPVNTSEELSCWQRDEDAWTAGLIEFMESSGCSLQEVSYVRELHEIPVGNFHADPQLNHDMSMLSLRFHRVKKIIDLYADRPVFED